MVPNTPVISVHMWLSTGYVRGAIYGGGTLITPPPNSTRHVRFWPYVEGGLSLPGAVRYFGRQAYFPIPHLTPLDQRSSAHCLDCILAVEYC